MKSHIPVTLLLASYPRNVHTIYSEEVALEPRMCEKDQNQVSETVLAPFASESETAKLRFQWMTS